jgi:hypothetical protein
MSTITPPSSTTNTQASPPSPLPHSLQNLNQISLHKLTHDNYPIWCTIIVPFLESQNLYGYVTGDISPPSQFIASPSSTPTSAAMVVNPAYSLWYQQDKIVLTAIISSLSENILVQVYGLHTSRDVWLALEKMFASQSKAHVMQSRFQLATLKKNSLPISEYFQKAQSLSHSLAVIQEPLKDSELISYILAGLGPEYESLITTITTRIDPISLDTLYGYLLTHEQRLEHLHSAPEFSISTANIAQRNTSTVKRFQ